MEYVLFKGFCKVRFFYFFSIYFYLVFGHSTASAVAGLCAVSASALGIKCLACGGHFVPLLSLVR